MKYKKILAHYGWIISLGCLLLHSCACGLAASTFSVYLPYIKIKYDFSDTQTSLINTVRFLSSMLSMLTAEWYYKKVSLRLGMTISCLILASSFMLLSQANSGLVCYLAVVVMGVAYSYGTMIPISFILRNWFQDRFGTAIGIATCGSGIITVIAPPIITKLVESYGLHKAFAVEAGYITICAVILYLILRDFPYELGLDPYRKANKEAEQQKKLRTADRKLMKRESMQMTIGVFLLGCVVSVYLNPLAIHFRTAGYSSLQAASAISFYGMVLIAGKILFGIASDRFGTYRVNYFFLISWILACFTTARVTVGSIPLLYTATFLGGIGTALATVGITVWSGELSSADTYVRNMQHYQFMSALGQLIWSPTPGIIADVTGSYSFSYILSGFIVILALIFVQMTYRKSSLR
ncbi:MAG TPA: MFS transporter [Bacillota bacterium]|nr:MFS transporter [Bacillota bacterium]HQE66098.1 MFS transporter [Bacillota bacterium]HQL35872.1 MFS transporter [Bacillota bacterium]HRS21510.1 MFS transporter [Clostridia bacterium]